MPEDTRAKVSGPRPVRPKPAAAKPAAAKPTATKQAARAAGTPDGDRIAKVLSRAGVVSRREAERLIEMGEVQVNGKTIRSAALNVTASDRITVSGEPVGAPEPARLWLYYKPEGLVTSASDEKGRETVFDHLPEDMPRVMSIGRLDLNSEGLLLLTNDGGLKRQLELPSTGWLRKYRVRVKGNPTDPELEPLRRGIVVEGDSFQPMDVALDRHQGSNAWLTVGLREGKNREIRRAINAIGMIVNRLIRVSYGPFRLNDLQPGQVEEIRARVLRDQLGTLLPGTPEAAEAPARKPDVRKPDARKPGVRTTSRTGGDSAAPARRPGSQTGAPRGDAGGKPAERRGSQPEAAAPPPTRGRTYKPGPKPRDAEPAGKPKAKPAPKPGARPVERSGPGPKPSARSGPKPGGKPPARRK